MTKWISPSPDLLFQPPPHIARKTALQLVGRWYSNEKSQRQPLSTCWQSAQGEK